jgi:DNA-binding transcriptional LysR family regulator
MELSRMDDIQVVVHYPKCILNILGDQQMDLRQLRYFVVVAEELNFQRAGKRLDVCAPPLLMQMRKLQDSLGVELLKTIRRRLQLTVEGRFFLEEARTILATAERGMARVRQVAEGDAGRLTIGCNAVAEFGILPHILASFRRVRPQVELLLRSLRTPHQLTELLERRLDVGFVCAPIPTDELDVKELTRQPCVVAVPKEHPLAEVPAVSFEALSGVPLITCSRTLDPQFFSEIEAGFRSAGAQMEVAYEAESSLSMIALVAAGSGCCIVPAYARQFTSVGIVCKPLAGAQIEHTLAIARRQDRRGLAAVFCDFVAEQAGAAVSFN